MSVHDLQSLRTRTFERLYFDDLVVHQDRDLVTLLDLALLIHNYIIA